MDLLKADTHNDGCGLLGWIKGAHDGSFVAWWVMIPRGVAHLPNSCKKDGQTHDEHTTATKRRAVWLCVLRLFPTTCLAKGG